MSHRRRLPVGEAEAEASLACRARPARAVSSPRRVQPMPCPARAVSSAQRVRVTRDAATDSRAHPLRSGAPCLAFPVSSPDSQLARHLLRPPSL